MTDTLAPDYTIDQSRFRETPAWDLGAPIAGAEAIKQTAESQLGFVAVPPVPVPAPSWLAQFYTGFARWLKNCADNYAAAAAYDDLSRLSDTELNHRGLSWDVLARDLREWGA